MELQLDIETRKCRMDIMKRYTELTDLMSQTKEDPVLVELDSLARTLKTISDSIKGLISFYKVSDEVNYVSGEEEEDLNDLSKANKPEEGFVYIAKQLNESNIYKIGLTNNITKRGNTFKTGNAFVEMVASLKTSKYKELEKQIHFREQSSRFKGEWFKLEKDQLSSLITDYKFNIHLEDNNA